MFKNQHTKGGVILSKEIKYIDNKEDFFDKYVDKNVINKKITKKTIVKIIFCIIAFFASSVLQRVLTRSVNNISGVIAQIQVIISVYLVVSIPKTGYFVAVALNMVQALFLTLTVFVHKLYSASPGIVVPLSTILTISIISFFARRLNVKFAEAQRQKEELVVLYEEISSVQDELTQQNELLLENSHVLSENEKKLNHLAFFDVLTELPNRKMIINQLDLLINLSSQEQRKFAVVFIDLDDFKNINDSVGHHTGDLLLQEVAFRLKGLQQPHDMLGRLGGDEFAFIIQYQFIDEELFEYVEKVRTSLLAPFDVNKTEITISASLGIALYPQDGKDSAELLKCADTAMYKAKENGGNGIQFFCIEMKEEILKKIEFEKRLKSAIKNGELYLAFQPQYSTNDRQLVGFEALARWESYELGPIPPLKFIPLAEETGLIVEMGEWILRTACSTFKKLHDTYNTKATVAVNISAVQIMNPSFVEIVKNILDETGIRPDLLKLEITESVFITSMKYVVNVLNQLKKLGICIALDDFGTGYSSLGYLQNLPIDTIKIDKSFIDSINFKTDDKQLVGSIIALVHQMGFDVIAEGVENTEQLEYLRKQKCDCIQGYLWGKPLKESLLESLILQESQPSLELNKNPETV